MYLCPLVIMPLAAAAAGVDGLRLASRGRLLVHLGFFIIVSVASLGAADKTDYQFSTHTKEYCSSERFEVRCPPNSLLLIHKALFGRMRAGRCVSAEYAHALGCHADVTNYIDTRCSGRQNCSMIVGVFDSIAQPCPKDFKAYLEVTHQCVKVPIDGCSGRTVPSISVSGEGYLALSPTLLARVGSCRWSFSAEGGRKLRFRLITDINMISQYFGQEDAAEKKRMYCDTRLKFHEGSVITPVKLCRTQTQSPETLFSSTTSHVKLEAAYHASSPRTTGNVTPLLIQYKVFGCREIIPPDGASVRHTPQGVAVICNQSLETWWLTCKHDKWIGEFGNCSKAHFDPMPTLPSTKKEIQNGIVLAVMVGVVLGIVVGACMLCVIFIVRRSKKRNVRSRATTDDLQYEPRMRNEEPICDVGYPSLLHHEKSVLTSSEYEHMCTSYPASFKSGGGGPCSQVIRLQMGGGGGGGGGGGPPQTEGECKYDRALTSADRVKSSGYQSQPIGAKDPMTYYDLEPQANQRAISRRPDAIVCDNQTVGLTSTH